MRYGNASIIGALSIGALLAHGGCGSDGDPSVFGQSGSSGSLTGSGSSGTLTGSGTNTGIIMTGSGSGTGTGSGTFTGGSGTGTGGLDPDAACASQAQDSNAIPSDIFIMLDKSGSMNCAAADTNCENIGNMTPVQPTRWKAVTDALNTFVVAPGTAGIGVGIGFFSLSGNNACSIPAYATPAVPIAMLPGSGAAISGAIAMNMPSGNTPTTQALTGAINYAKTYTMNTPGRAASVVFVTDGLPNGCTNNTVANAAMAAQAAFMGTPSIKTYVVGLGNTANLDQIALAGSGGATHFFPATGDVAGQLVAALKTISGTITCDYTLPMANTFDPLKVNVQVTVGAGGTPQNVGVVTNAAACGTPGGWFYDVNPPMKPSKITLCPQSCDPLKANEGSKLQILLGCPSLPPPGIN